MKLKISSWAIDHPTPVVLMFLLLSLLGLAAYWKLPVAGNPRVELPIINVSVSQPGASPEELEANVARRLEDAVAGVAGIKHTTTTIANGNVQMTLEFVLEASIDRAANDVRDAVAQARPQLPQNIAEPQVTRVDVSGGALLSYAVRSDTLGPAELSRLVDERLGPRLLGVRGVQQFKRLGGAVRELRVELDPARMSAAGATVGEIVRQLRGAEVNAPGGTVSNASGQLLPIRVMGSSDSAAALARRPILLSSGRTVALGDLGAVQDTESASELLALLDGQPVVTLDLYRKRGASELAMAEAVKAALKEFEAEEPQVRLELFYDGVDATRLSFGGARDTLIEGVILTVLVIWLFLRDGRATWIAATAIPLSLLPTMLVMQLKDFQLDSVSLLALILVIGILVDDAIVEIENIERRIERGESPRQAAATGADSLGLAVVAITLTIVAVFLPVSFIGGVVGKYFSEFGLTTTFAVLSSLVVARLVTPLMCAHLLRPKPHAKREEGAMERGYIRLLNAVLAHPRRSLAAGAALLVLTLGLVGAVPSGFMPKTRPLAIKLNYELAPGATLADSARAAESLRHALHGLPDVLGVFAYDRGSPELGGLRVLLKPLSERQQSQGQLEAALRERMRSVPDLRSTLMLLDGSKELNLSFVSRDGAKLSASMEKLADEVRALPQLRDVELAQQPLMSTLDVRLRPEEAARLGVDTQAVADALRLATIRELDALLPQLPLDSRQIVVRPRLAGGKSLDLEQLRQIPVPTAKGGTVPLAVVAELQRNSARAGLTRLNRERSVQLQANLTPGVTISQAMEAIEALPAYKGLPAGVRQAAYGETEYMNEMFEQFAIAAMAGLVAVYAVLVLLFDDWLQPLTIMLALPLSLCGAAAALLMTGHSLNLSTVIGLLMLFGIVGKNSILLVDFIVEARKAGAERMEAILHAGRDRMRPILMTTLAMVGGMLPAALGWGHDDGFRAPMAIAVIGGLLTSTLLSLVFVPLVYLEIDALEHRFKAWVARLRPAKEST